MSGRGRGWPPWGASSRTTGSEGSSYLPGNTTCLCAVLKLSNTESALYMRELELLRLTKHSPPFIIFSIFTLLLVSASSWLIVCVSLKIFPQLGPSPVKYIWIYSDLNISRYLRFIRQGNIMEILFLTPHLVIAEVSATSCWSQSWTSRRGSKWYHQYLRLSSSRSTQAGSFYSWPRTGYEYFYI